MDYVSNTDEQLQEMLEVIGVDSYADLLESVPQSLHLKELDLPAGISESEMLQDAEKLAALNQALDRTPSFLGAGAYHHQVPTVVDAIASRGEWLTPYTPYQAEASQGILQSIYEFQTMVCELTGMDIANASLYDGASAAAEAVLLALRQTRRKRILISEAVHPHTRQVIAAYLRGSDTVIQEVATLNGVTDIEALEKSVGDDVACVLLQNPNVFGVLEPCESVSQIAHRNGGLMISSFYPASLGMIAPPGQYDADIAVAEGRCLGSPVSLGGPGLGLFAAKESLIRRVPGRLVGATVDQQGKRAFTLTLQTREQHIRRDKATSNICTNQGWLALRATVFMSLLGPKGLADWSQLNFDKAHYAFDLFTQIPWIQPAFDQPFFNEFALKYDDGVDASKIHRRLVEAGWVPGHLMSEWFPMMKNVSLWCVTETMSKSTIDRMAETLKGLRV